MQTLTITATTIKGPSLPLRGASIATAGHLSTPSCTCLSMIAGYGLGFDLSWSRGVFKNRGPWFA